MFLNRKQNSFSHKFVFLFLLAFGVFSASAQETDKNPETQKAETAKYLASSVFTQNSQPVKILEKPRGILKGEYGNVCVQGTARVRVRFLASGEVSEVKAINNLPYGITESAVEAAKKIRFEPAKKDDVPITVSKVIEYSFDWLSGKMDFAFVKEKQSQTGLSDKAQQSYKFRGTSYLRWDLGEVFSLNEFAAELEKVSGSNGVVILFGKRGESLSYAREVEKWLSNSLGIDPARISAGYSGESEKRKMELWIVPKGAKSPTLMQASSYKEATLWNTYSIPCEVCELARSASLNALAEEIKHIPNSKVFIIFHPSKSEESVIRNKRDALKVAVKAKKYLNKLKIRNSRIVTLVGNYEDWDHGEFWIVPHGAKPPFAKTTAFNRKASSKKF